MKASHGENCRTGNRQTDQGQKRGSRLFVRRAEQSSEEKRKQLQG